MYNGTNKREYTNTKPILQLANARMHAHTYVATRQHYNFCLLAIPPFHCLTDSRWSLQRRSLSSKSPRLLRGALCELPLEFGMGLLSTDGIRVLATTLQLEHITKTMAGSKCSSCIV